MSTKIKMSRRLYNNLVVWLDSQNLPGDAIITLTQEDSSTFVEVDSMRIDYHTETILNE
jgi:hypothetical protein